MLREVSKRSGIPSDEPFRAVVLKYLNIILGSPEARSKQFWEIEVKKELEQKFPQGTVHHSHYSHLHTLTLTPSISAVRRRETTRVFTQSKDQLACFLLEILQVIFNSDS
jgi:hypothetical protein